MRAATERCAAGFFSGSHGGRFIPFCSPVMRCVIVAPETVKIESMSRLSTARKFAAVARVAWQVVGQHASRNRTLNAVGAAARATARSCGHVLHLLWLEVTGTIFLSLAAVGLIALSREWSKYQAGHTTSVRLAVAVLFTVTFAWFGLSSFWRVRRKGRGAR
jgi:hypothetical protein